MSDNISGYALWMNALGHTAAISIAEDDYNEIARASRTLGEVTNFEEKFFAICECFREIEQYIFGIKIHHMLYNHGNSDDMFMMRTEFGRLALSFLSAARLYQHTIKTHIKKISGEALSQKKVEDITSQYGRLVYEYRVMEQVRNHVQHRALPVQNAWIGAA